MINVTTELQRKPLKKIYIFFRLGLLETVAMIANDLMVLFSSSLGDFIMVDCLLNKTFHTNT